MGRKKSGRPIQKAINKAEETKFSLLQKVFRGELQAL
jgi:hypothetical protein